MQLISPSFIVWAETSWEYSALLCFNYQHILENWLLLEYVVEAMNPFTDFEIVCLFIVADALSLSFDLIIHINKYKTFSTSIILPFMQLFKYEEILFCLIN